MTVHKFNQPENTAGMEYLPIKLDAIRVAEWHPLPDGLGDPTEVHVHLEIEHLPEMPMVMPMVMRFKGPETLDQFILALAEHRRNVWPRSLSEKQCSKR